jgi:cytosine/adenosine deaminase-related metal-dependent hydrolase
VSLLIRNATILTMNDGWDVVSGDISIANGRITSVGASPPNVEAVTTIDAEGGLVLPGFVQTHIHLCQTLFRGAADDLPLLAWLRERVWPLEAAHDDTTLAALGATGRRGITRGRNDVSAHDGDRARHRRRVRRARPYRHSRRSSASV